jgi:CRP-like cAMP-binding protein/membrane protein YdbS with pleckstrin-like domain
MSQSSNEEFLSKLALFAELDEEEISGLAQITDEYEFSDGAIIAYQRDVADKLIIVRTGRLFAEQVDDRGIVRDTHTRAYLEGDCFKDTWLFIPQVHESTVRATEGGRLLFIEQLKFLEYLDNYPDVIDYLELSEEARHAAEHSQVAIPSRQIQSLNLTPDEIVDFNERRSVWLLVFRGILPLLLMVALVVFALASLQTLSTFVLVFIGLGIVLLGLFLGVLVLDWSNDFFVITNKHLIHREFSLLRTHVTVNRTPMDQVQSVEVLRPNVLATLTNTGSTRITTAAQSGAILFDYINDPARVKEIINKYREQVKATVAGRDQVIMRDAMEQYFEATPAVNKIEDTDDDEEEELISALGLVSSFLSIFRRSLSSRVEEGGIITYRKHFFTLLGRIWLPALMILVFIAGSFIFFSILVMPATILTILIFLLIFFILSGWFIWRFEDWRNDTFQLTELYVIDIDRRPFGFGESRKQAELGNVQNVNAERPGFLATIFNYGNVIIDTAGASADITFEKVVKPSLVQSDIFKRREEFKGKQRFREGEQRRKEYAVLMDVYRQAEEQNRIPRRTPPQGVDPDDSD